MSSDTVPFSMADEGERDLVGTRLFDAPRERVWEAFTTPTLVSKWLLGPPGWSMPVCEMDVKPGGQYHHVWHNDEGKAKDFGMSGVFREVMRPERIVQLERRSEEDTLLDCFTTSEFVSNGDDKTLFTIRIVCRSREARDGMRATRMEWGMNHSYNRLAELLAKA